MTDAETALLLARIQFAFTISFHFIFPAFSIGLASYLAVLEGLWLRTGKAVYLALFRYWLKIFAMAFAMGVVSGIVMSYQFGTNWSVFSDKAGPIIGPLMAYEVLTAFFLEAGFLGVMLFGMNRVGKGLHFAATLMVAIGTCISAFWILSVNSWMHTPTGWAMNAVGQFVPAGSWTDIVFNPSFPYRLVHTVIAAYLTTALVVGGVGAWHLLKGRDLPGVRTMFSMAMWMAALVAPIQIFVGDLHRLVNRGGHVHPVRGEPGRHQRRRPAREQFGAHPREQQHVRPQHAAVHQVADDGDAESGEPALVFHHREGVEQRLRRVLVHAVAGVDDLRAADARQQVARPGRGVTHHDHVGRHRFEIEGGVDERLAFHHARSRDRHIQGVGAQPLLGDLEGGARARARLEEQVHHGPPPQRGHLLDGALRDLLHGDGRVEDEEDLFRRQVGDAEQVLLPQSRGRRSWTRQIRHRVTPRSG